MWLKAEFKIRQIYPRFFWHTFDKTMVSFVNNKLNLHREISRIVFGLLTQTHFCPKSVFFYKTPKKKTHVLISQGVDPSWPILAAVAWNQTAGNLSHNKQRKLRASTECLQDAQQRSVSCSSYTVFASSFSLEDLQFADRHDAEAYTFPSLIPDSRSTLVFQQARANMFLYLQ